MRSGSRTNLGSGDHQSNGWPCSYQGKIPWLYAASSQSASNEPPAASNPLGSANAREVHGKMGASIGSNQGNGIAKTSRRGISRRPVQPCSQILHWSPLGGRPGPRCHRPQIHRKYWFALPCRLGRYLPPHSRSSCPVGL